MRATKGRKSTPVQIAIAGLGRAGWDIHVAALRGRKDFVITAVVDPFEDRLTEAAAEFGCQTFRDWPRFLKEAKAEIVVIATQSRDHARMAREALRAGFHVLVEKPMATRWQEVDRLLATAKEYKRILTVHQNHRLDPVFLHVQQVIRSGKLGRIFMIRHGEYGFSRRNDWQVLRKYGGGQLNNWGVHLIDHVLQLLDAPVKEVFGDLQQIINPGDVEDQVKVVMRSESGQLADVEVSAACAIPLPKWTVMGTRGTLVSDGNESRLRYCTGKLPTVKPVDSTGVAGRAYGFGERIQFKEETIPSTATASRDFYGYLYDSLRKGKPLFVTPESVRALMWVIHQARKGSAFR